MKINSIEYSPIFKKGVKRAKKKHFDLSKLELVIQLIVEDKKDILKRKFKDHALVGSHQGLRELHIEDNWLLVYRIIDEELILYLIATGNHDEVFNKSKY